MNRQPYKAEKRRKEIARQKKQEEKRLKRLEKKKQKEDGTWIEGETPEVMPAEGEAQSEEVQAEETPQDANSIPESGLPKT